MQISQKTQELAEAGTSGTRGRGIREGGVKAIWEAILSLSIVLSCYATTTLT